MRRTILALSSSTGEAESEVRMVFNNFERLGLHTDLDLRIISQGLIII